MNPSALIVLLGGRPIAELAKTTSGALRLTYTDPTTVPLSLSLPAEQAVHTGPVVERWIDALLPDNSAALAAIERQFGADRRNPLGLLEAVGLDCAGAVQFASEARLEAAITRTGELVAAPDWDIEARLAMLSLDEAASWTMPGEHWSLGGTQQKFTLRRASDRWYYALGAEPTTHIVKPGIRGLAAQALVEHISMAAARQVGVAAAETSYTSFGSEDALVVTRFDRVVTNEGELVRLHQEDLCQALGAAAKYEEYGGPSALDLIRLLRDHSHTAADARRNVARLVDGLIVNTILGAPDAHARNYAVMLTATGPLLAPLFDVAAGLAYAVPDGQRRALSMSVGGQFALDRIGAAQWRQFAVDAELEAAVVLGRVVELAEAIPGAVEEQLDAAADFEGADDLRARLLPAVARNATRIVA